jgi:zinc protease
MFQRSLGERCRTLLVLLACCTFIASPSASVALAPRTTLATATHGDDDVPVSVQTLANGLRIVAVEDPAAPVVSTSMWYRFGSTDERPGKTGLAHAVAHMMYDGTPYLSAAGLDDIVSRLGAKETATTSNDYTAYRFVIPADKLELALRVEADRMQHLLIDDAAWQREKKALLAEREGDLSGPLTKLYYQVCLAASASPVCALSALGDSDAISQASSEDIRSYYQDWYAPNNATLVVSGDVSSATVFALAHELFDAIPRGNLPTRNTDPPFFAQDKQVEVAGDFPYEVVDLAFPAPGTLDPDSGALAIIDSIVNNRRSDFWKALVHSGYTYGYSTQLDQNLHGGLYHVFLIAAQGHTSAQARDAFSDVMRTAQESGFPDDLIRAAKIAISRRQLYARDSISGLGERVGYAFGVEGRTSLATDGDAVEKTSSNDVTAAARRYLAIPAVTGLLSPSATQSVKAPPGPPATSVTDDFSRRPPFGPIVEARAFRELSVAPVTLASLLRPEAFVLPNGLRVLVQEQHASPTVFVQGACQTSPAFDPPGKDGLGAMFSNLLDDGSTTVGFDDRHRTLDELGASMTLALNFEAHGRAQDFGTLIDLIADALQHPALRAAAVDAVRKETLSAVAERDEDPDERADADFDLLMFGPDDPSARQPTATTIGAITAADLRAYGRRYVRPDLTVITIAGDVDPQAVRETMTAAFGAWRSAGPKPDLNPGPIPVARAALRYVVSNRTNAQARLGAPAVSHGSADYPALSVLDEILGAGGAFDTRLVEALQTRLNLASRVESVLHSDRYRGTFEFALTAAPRHLSAAVSELRAQLNRLHDDPIGPFELSRARTKIVAGGFVSEESTQVVTSRVQTIGLDGLPLDYERTLPAAYAKLDGATLIDVANRYLHPEDLVEVYEGPNP